MIAEVDCPEFAGARCGYFEDRGSSPPTVIPRTEVPLVAAELALDYLTPRYRRRVAALRAGATAEAPPVAAVDVARVLAARPTSGSFHAPGVPLNVPADRVRGPVAPPDGATPGRSP